MSNVRSNIGWLPPAATAVAVLSCYGTTVLIGLLSLLGVTLAVDPDIWATAISIFATLATATIGMSGRRLQIAGPTLVAALGLVLILWAMNGTYNRGVEFAGFVLLVAATLWDRRSAVGRGTAAEGILWIEADALADRINRIPEPIIVDVRESEEFDGYLGHLANALNLPVGELPDRLTQIDAFKDEPIVLVCRTDKRSAHAWVMLRDAGFRDVYVLRGGMERWNEKGLPVQARDI